MKEAYKHRLIGAAILGAVTVLFLPSFFKDKQQFQVDTESHIPLRPQITAVDFDEPSQPADVQPAPAPETMFVPETVTETSQSAKPPAVAAVDADPVPDMPLNAEGLPDAWVLQVASLSSKESAAKLRDQLQSQGYKAYMRSIKIASGEAHRVYIGPKLDKAETLKLKQDVDKKLKVNSLVLPFKP